MDLSVITEVRPVLDVDRDVARFDHPNLVAERQVDLRNADLITREGCELQPPGIDFGKYGITREH